MKRPDWAEGPRIEKESLLFLSKVVATERRLPESLHSCRGPVLGPKVLYTEVNYRILDTLTQLPMPEMVRVEEGESALIRLAQERLVQKGTDKILGLFGTCPNCGRQIKGVRLASQEWKCSRCGHSQKGIKLGPGGSLPLGSVAGIGVVALLRWLREQESRPIRRP